MKMSGPKRVLTFRSDIKTSFTCEIHSCELIGQTNSELEREDITEAADAIQMVEAPLDGELSSKKAAKEKFKVDQVASRQSSSN